MFKKLSLVFVLALLALMVVGAFAPAMDLGMAAGRAPAIAQSVGHLAAPVLDALLDGLSFSLDFTGVFSNASQIVNGLFPIFLVPLGITLGIGILGVITKAFSGIIRS